MTITSGAYDRQLTAMHWKLLRYHILYRLLVASALFGSLLFSSQQVVLFESQYHTLHLVFLGIYALALGCSLVTLYFYKKYFNWQLTAHMLADILLLVLLIHTGGKLSSGLGIIFLSSLAGAGLVGEGRLVLFYAAVASIAVLLEEFFSVGNVGLEVVDFFQTGLFCIGFFVVAISAKLLAKRVLANEELARKRGEALKNQVLINQSVIEEMQDGVLVLDRDGWVKQHNPRADEMLGIEESMGLRLVYYSADLALAFQAWCSNPESTPEQVTATKTGILLQTRFVPVKNGVDVLAFLEDAGLLQEQARQLKLAALGRLTANIAHEIRNPLSAINHAGELLREEAMDKASTRLLSIMLDNTQRVERIVKDVLELGRRDRAHSERIDLRQSLPILVDEFVVKENIPADTVHVEISGYGVLYFDPFHLYQILWNLMGNALRHCSKNAGSILLHVQDSRREWLELHVMDDGAGIKEEFHDQVFEPFFTTHSHGTGLGLYIARELCEANNARIELINGTTGADFCIIGRASG